MAAEHPIDVYGVAFCIDFYWCSFNSACCLGREYEVVDLSIKSCSYLEQLKVGIGAESYRARWMVVCGACAILVFPAYHLRLGLVNSCEIRNFPSGLKGKLVIAAWMNMIGVFWLVVAFVLIKFGS